MLILCSSMMWTRSLCLSALPSYRAPDEVIRTVTGVARLHCLYLAGVSVVRCQIVFTVVVYLLSVSVFQVLKLFSPGRVSVYPCRVRTGLYSLPELETLHCRVYCTCTADDICTSTVFGVCTCTASLSHLHCVLELSNKDYLFSLAIGSRAFCTVTVWFRRYYIIWLWQKVKWFPWPPQGVFAIAPFLKMFSDSTEFESQLVNLSQSHRPVSLPFYFQSSGCPIVINAKMPKINLKKKTEEWVFFK